jgi:N-methylhydantoinase A/oxoprolinase/acetone carboxylase beta subunit
MSFRIGIDVGGTNTHAVLMDGPRVIAKVETPTTEDVTSGISTALHGIRATSGTTAARISAVMIATTHFTNAVIERRHLQPTACVRLGLPATAALPPMIDWPSDLRDAIGSHAYLCHGGNELDGRPLWPFDAGEVARSAADIAARGIRSVAVSAVFSPVNPEMEQRAAEIIAAEIPDAAICLSHEIGRIGMLERENAVILNACLHDLAARTVAAFRAAMAALDIEARLYLAQNDGTLMSADFAERYPVLTIASGPTSSMRGAAFLSGRKDAMVIDVGGTTSDTGALTHGFPRDASVAVDIGGVRTNFRMPDVYSFGLGGGSLVHEHPLRIGPQSVGYQLTERALVLGGDTLTATDVAVAAGVVEIGDRSRVMHLEPALVRTAMDSIQEMVETVVDRMKTSAEPIPGIVVGGGSILIGKHIADASETVKPEHFEAAGAVGAALAQISGEVDRVYALHALSREQALDRAKQEATDKAIAAGADPATIEIVDVEDVPLAYLPGNATRIRVKAAGSLTL